MQTFKHMKRIVDPVHGNIYIEKKYFRFIDTKYFQRLRRIEQSSIRSIFPCARHDRFSHSIGVFHMGKRIVKQLSKESDFYSICDNENESKEKYNIIVNSYLIACLLHDIAHAPFSHTFEKYYGETRDLCKKLNDLLENKIDFDEDDYVRIKEHEIVSAILIADIFRDEIEGDDFQGDCELVVRMVIGQIYNDDETIENQIRNCFISLLNGCIVDADRLDYVCRDVWASGYKTATIDFERLISNIYLRPATNDGKRVVCFDVNVVNEVLSLNEIRTFQTTRVFCHHTVMYEQYLFEQAALKMMESIENVELKGLNNIINYSTFMSPQKQKFKLNQAESNCYKFYLVADEDLLFLMKQSPDNKFYEDWSERKIEMCPIWETEEAFFYEFHAESKKFGPKNNALIEAIEQILQENGFEQEKYLVKNYKRKNTKLMPSFYIIEHNDKVVDYLDYTHETKIVDNNGDDYFYYIYVDKNIWKAKTQEDKVALRKRIGDKIVEYCRLRILL